MELTKNTLEYWETPVSRICNFEEGTDAIVPDTFPDIGRIVCAGGTLQLKDAAPQKDRMMFSGSVKAAVLYEPEGEGGLRRLDVPLQFAHIEECRGLGEGAVCFARCTLAGVEAALVNSRKISVTARVACALSAHRQATLTYTCDVDPGEHPLQTRFAAREVTLTDALAAVDFTVLEDAQQADYAEMTCLSAACTFRTNECRAMNGKAVVRGEAVLTGLGLQPDGAVRTFEQVTPFMQVFECEGLDEGDPVAVRLAARSVDCQVDGSVLSYSIGATALLHSEKTHRLNTVDDLYSITHSLRTETRPLSVEHLRLRTPLSAEAGCDLEIVGGASHLVEAHAVITGGPIAGDGAEVPICCSGLYENADGKLFSFTRNLTLKFPQIAAKGRWSDLTLQTVSAVCAPSGVTLRLRLGGCCDEVETLSLRDLTALSVGEALPDTRGGVTLLLRFLEGETALWDVARSCGTTVEAICTANGLPAGTETAATRLLLIPLIKNK